MPITRNCRIATLRLSLQRCHESVFARISWPVEPRWKPYCIQHTMIQELMYNEWPVKSWWEPSCIQHTMIKELMYNEWPVKSRWEPNCIQHTMIQELMYNDWKSCDKRLIVYSIQWYNSWCKKITCRVATRALLYRAYNDTSVDAKWLNESR